MKDGCLKEELDIANNHYVRVLLELYEDMVIEMSLATDPECVP